MRVDIDFNLTPHPLTGDLSIKTKSTAIRQSIINIVMTNYYERGFNIEFGSNIRKSLFENSTPVTANILADDIKLALKNFEPQVEVLRVDLKDNDDHTMTANIWYTELNDPTERGVAISLSKLR